MSESDRVKAVISTASIPFVFQPVKMGDLQLVDGGTFTALNVGDPIDRCREEGVEDKDIIVDIIMCLDHFANLDKWTMQETSWKDALSIFLRRDKIGYYYNYFEDVISVTRGFHDVFFRYVLYPSQKPPSGGLIPINTTKEDTKAEIRLGYDDGKKAIEFSKK